MASLFNKDPVPKPALDPYSRERIDDEVAHLRQRDSVRHADGKSHGWRGAWPAMLLFLIVVVLFFMDPVIHSFRRYAAIRDYLYLHQYGSDRKASELLATGIFTPPEIELLNLRQGSFQNYYSGPVEADREADSIIGYLKGVALLHQGFYDRLGPVDRIRYQLFVRWGLHPPESWSLIDPPIRD